jgi:putative glutamine amidotransferase
LRPCIGITSRKFEPETRYSQNDNYVDAVWRAGGYPVILPCVEDPEAVDGALAMVDGILVAGGPDIDPHYFGEEPEPGLGDVVPAMDAFEVPLIQGAIRQGIPVLGICRGEQVLNVALGGKLFQDIKPGKIMHQQKAPRYHRSHRVDVVDRTRLGGLIGAGEHLVNSFHHQAVSELGKGLIVTAAAPDDTIEGVELPGDLFVVGVQWHPECFDNLPDGHQALFRGFVEECGR